jgi:hypothetical protein
MTCNDHTHIGQHFYAKPVGYVMDAGRRRIEVLRAPGDIKTDCARGESAGVHLFAK